MGDVHYTIIIIYTNQRHAIGNTFRQVSSYRVSRLMS